MNDDLKICFVCRESNEVQGMSVCVSRSPDLFIISGVGDEAEEPQMQTVKHVPLGRRMQGAIATTPKP